MKTPGNVGKTKKGLRAKTAQKPTNSLPEDRRNQPEERLVRLGLAVRDRSKRRIVMKKMPQDVGKDADWAYQNMSVPVEMRENPPTAGAVALLDWALKSPHDFFLMYLGRRLPTKAMLDDEVQRASAGKSNEELLESLIRAAGGHAIVENGKEPK